MHHRFETASQSYELCQLLIVKILAVNGKLVLVALEILGMPKMSN